MMFYSRLRLDSLFTHETFQPLVTSTTTDKTCPDELEACGDDSAFRKCMLSVLDDNDCNADGVVTCDEAEVSRAYERTDDAGG